VGLRIGGALLRLMILFVAYTTLARMALRASRQLNALT
jgi:hypothetical protein